MEHDPERDLITSGDLVDLPPPSASRRSKPLNVRRRLMVTFLLIIGVGTFFAPTIHTDPPVLGRAVWSPFDIVTQLHAGALPAQTDDRHPEQENRFSTYSVESYFAAVYLLLLLALLTVAFFPSPKHLAVFVMLDAFIVFAKASRSMPHDFEDMFYGWRGGWGGNDVHIGQHKLMLLAVDLLILGVVFLVDAD